MAHDYAGERRILKDGFEPLNPGKVQMVGGLIEKQNVRPLHQPLGDAEAFAPAAREISGGGFKIHETGAAKRLGGAGRPLHQGDGCSFQCFLHDGSDRLPRRKIGHLCDIAEPAALACRDIAAIRFYATLENLKQSRLTRAIGTNQADPIAFRHDEGDILEQRGDPVTLR